MLTLITAAAGGVLPGVASGGPGVSVSNYGRCVANGTRPSDLTVAPATYVDHDGVMLTNAPHMSVDGTAPPAFGDSGWAGCSG